MAEAFQPKVHRLRASPRRGGARAKEEEGPQPSAVPRYFVVTPCFSRAAVDASRSRLRYGAPSHARSAALRGWTPSTALPWSPALGRARMSSALEDAWNRYRLRALRRFVARHGLTNMKLIPAEEYIWDPNGKGPPTIPMRLPLERPEPGASPPPALLLSHGAWTQVSASRDAELGAQFVAPRSLSESLTVCRCRREGSRRGESDSGTPASARQAPARGPPQSTWC